jgi:microcompartment protein CcmL/EutN
MKAKEVVNEITGVRKTRDGNILIELKAGTSAIDIAERIKTLTENKVIPKPLQNMVSIEIKNSDQLTDVEELRKVLSRDLKINNANCVENKTLRPNPWGTQQAIAVIPASILPVDSRNLKIKTADNSQC